MICNGGRRPWVDWMHDLLRPKPLPCGRLAVPIDPMTGIAARSSWMAWIVKATILPRIQVSPHPSGHGPVT